MDYHLESRDDIAIVGMSCRVAGASSPSELWDNLVRSKDVQSRINRFTGYYHPDGGKRKGLTNVGHAYTIEGNVEAFDNTFFSIPPIEAVAMDVQQRLLLELTYEAFENAGILLDSVRGSDTAVFAGIHGMADYASSLLRDLDATTKYTATGVSSAISANRISYFFDIHGASMIIDTACSSTIVALHQAIAAIRSGESKMALVAGANVILDPAMFVHMSELGFLSPTGRCRSFDSEGNGYARGEGVLALVLKPLKDAIKDGDSIRALVKATRINQDGRTQGLNLPSSDAQKRNLEAIYTNNNLDPLDIQYLEAHGTGTVVGDPLELSAINAVFNKNPRSEPLVVGSIKSNVGHLEAGAALVGLVKTVLALEHGEIPPQMHLKTLNPKIDWSNIHVPTTTENWPPTKSGKRMAALNSFGFGGTNGHAVLQHYTNRRAPSVGNERPYLFMVSAASKCSLGAMQQKFATYIEVERPELVSLAHTLLARRSLLKYSKFYSARSHEELVEKLKIDESPLQTRSQDASDSLTFVFTGQGAQWPQMGAQMINTSPLFRAIMVELDGHLAELPDKPEWSIIEELSKPKETSRVYISSFSQPLCSAIQIGLVDVLRSWDTQPSAILGHSSGEVAAAYAAGILSRRDAIVVAFYRGLFLGQDKLIDPSVKPAGAMCAVGLSEKDATELISSFKGRIALAAVNSPSSCTLSGDYDAIEEIITLCKSKGIFCRALRVDMAYHSHHMLPKSSAYQEAMEKAGVKPIVGMGDEPKCRMFSSVYGRRVKPEECNPSYWKSNMVSTVKFHHALVAATKAMPTRIFLEIGPHAALKGPAGDSLASMDLTDWLYSGTFSRGKPDFESLLETASFLAFNRGPINLNAVNAVESLTVDGKLHQDYGTVLQNLPGYCWDHSNTFNAESRLSRNTKNRQTARHELLGARLPIDNSIRLMWRNLLMTDEIKWLNDVLDLGYEALPESIYITMALEAARQIQTTSSHLQGSVQLRDICFQTPLELSLFSSPTTTVETLFTLSRITETEFQFSITFCTKNTSEAWVEACSGTLIFLESTYIFDPPPSVVHDKQALQYYEAFGTNVTEKLSSFNVSSKAISGDIENDCVDLENYHLDPVKLAEITQLPQQLLAAQNYQPYARFKLDCISSIVVPAGDWKFGNGIFRVEAEYCDAISGSVRILVSNDTGEYIQIERMLWSRREEQVSCPPLRSLFYITELQPDISVVDTLNGITLEGVVNLVTHKWPMADVVVSNTGCHLHNQITPLMQGLVKGERPRFRSLTVVDSSGNVLPSQRLIVKSAIKELAPESSDLVFCHNSEVSALLRTVKDLGIICAQADEDKCALEFEVPVVCLNNFSDTFGNKWSVMRKEQANEAAERINKTVVFATKEAPINFFENKVGFEVVSLDLITKWTPPQHSVGVIVLDFGKQSILLDWSGSDLLSWFQPLLPKLGHILWVGQNNEQYVAPSFIKTIHGEHPEISTSALLLEESPESQIGELVLDTFDRLVAGLTEAEQHYIGEVLHIKRYRPDDELSTSVGKLPPTKSRNIVGSQDYSLTISGHQSVSLATMRSSRDIEESSIEIQVLHSLLDWNDLRIFRQANNPSGSLSNLGFFCSGIVSKTTSDTFEIGSKVVAWFPGAHRKALRVPESRALRLESSQDLVEGLILCSFGALALSIVITARATPGDQFKTSISSAFLSVIEYFWKQLESLVPVSIFPKRTFNINMTHERGICVDDDSIDFSTFTEPNLQQIFRTLDLKSSITSIRARRFELSNAQAAFEYAHKSCSLTVVFDHAHTPNVTSSTITYSPAKYLFLRNRAYVVIGFGGLSRHIVSWMARNGAKHIYALSRRGSDSKDAREAINEVRSIGGELTIVKADACDFSALSKALSEIRLQHPIAGILNTVMVLGDSPLMTMEPQQWDQCVSAKVDSTTNAHLASSSDELDFFIMFSSISSISGNRMQANYATANAFKNAFAQYRQSLGLPGITIALGAVMGIGVMANNQALLRTFSQTGYYHVTAQDLEKILEAAIYESKFRDRSLITTGFSMFRTLNGKLIAKEEEDQVYWAESPEFGFLMEHNLSASEIVQEVSLKEKLSQASSEEAQYLLLDGVLTCLSSVLGYEKSAFDPKSPVSVYGFDSLNAVSARYWFFTQVGISVPVFEILGSKSITDLVSRTLIKLQTSSGEEKTEDLPQPKRNLDVTDRPLSHSQQRLFFLHRFIPDKTVYNLLLVCEAVGRIDIERFKVAWNMFVQRHEALHSKIVTLDDRFQQIPQDNPLFHLEHVQTSDIHFSKASRELLSVSRSFNFNPESGDLVRGYLLESPSRMKFFIASHHLAWDRTSSSIVFEETVKIYKALGIGQNPAEVLSADPIQFIDYTLWQNECISRPNVLNPQVDYWRQKLEGAPEAVSMLPAAVTGTRSLVKEYNVESIQFELSTELTVEIKEFCKVNAATAFMFLTSALTALIHRLTGDEDIVIAIADGDRGHSAFDKLVGFTVNLLPIRSKPKSEAKFSELLEEYRTACLEAYEHRSIPFDYLLQILQIPRRTAHSPVAQIAVNYQTHGAFAEVDYGDFQFTKFEHYNARIQTDFGLDIEETSDGKLFCTLDYDSKMYSRDGMAKFSTQYEATIVDLINSSGERKLGELSVDTSEDRLIVEGSLQPIQRLVRPLKDLDLELFPLLFQLAIRAFPTKIALFDRSWAVTYAELDSMTNSIANELIDSGLQVGDTVGVYCEQSIYLLIAIYGIVKAGGAYVPIDPDYPETRIESMIEDAQIDHILVDDFSQKAATLFACGVDGENIFEIKNILSLKTNIDPCKRLSRPLDPDDPFCCIFTSGSTGRPKGIHLKHSMLRYQQEEYNHILENSAEDRIALGVAMVFDLSLCSIFGSILLGATTAVATREERYNPAKMVDFFVDERITSVIFSPTQLKALFTAPNNAKLKEWKSLRNLTSCGEALPPWIVREFHALSLPYAKLYNAYAPAETTVVNSMAILHPEDARAKDCYIAGPMSTNKFYILDKNKNPVPLGTVGELYIGGCTVADGYVNRPELTEKVFHSDPWSTEDERRNGFGRMYQTGDSFRLTEDGRLHCLGRIGGDRQVKIRGMRTELGEIESAIFDASQLLDIDDGLQLSLAAVVFLKDENKDGILAAYLRLDKGEAVAPELQQSFEKYLRTSLKGSLPLHMIPSVFLFISDIPMTGSGKTDYKKLLERPLPQKRARLGMDNESLPLTPLQKKIAAVWREALNLEGTIAPDDNFFSLGGHSMMLMSVWSGVKKSVGVELQLADIFAQPTLAGMESLCLSSSKHAANSSPLSNGNGKVSGNIDWIKETSLGETADWLIDQLVFQTPRAIAMTGACTMVGAHFLKHVLACTDVTVYCLAVDTSSSNDGDASNSVESALRTWNLDKELSQNAYGRIQAFRGALSQPLLGLNSAQVALIDSSVQSIYHLDSEVSLLKDYASIRAGNIGALRFLLSLATSEHNPKPIHYLSTWGVPHLQAWQGTKTVVTTSSADWITSESEMSHITPESSSSTSYLKARWACEALLCAAAKRGLPVTIVRTTMCAPSPATGTSVARTDINRCILATSVEVGAVPDFASERGGGVSWMTADVLVSGLWTLTHKVIANTGSASIRHIISDQHILYRDLAPMLSLEGKPLGVVRPQEWFARLRSLGIAEIDMMATVLEQWVKEGWVPFKVESEETMRELQGVGIFATRIDGDNLRKLVIGSGKL